MAQQALGPGRTVPRKRVMFGLLDADGWGWAGVKAFAWMIIIIFILGYLPDRAYYFTVNRTIDLGILAWSPINLCPAEPNENLPCPAPHGAIAPWYPSPNEIALPAGRTDGAAIQLGTNILYIGGSDGQTAQADVYVAQASGVGNHDAWTAGPALPEPRSDAGVVFETGSIYVIGGYNADGAPTDTVFVLTPDATTGDLGEWETAGEDLTLPEPRAGAAVSNSPVGIVVAGGEGPDGATDSVWVAAIDEASGDLQPWEEHAPLFLAVSDATMAVTGDFIWVYGGTGADGQAVGAVQRGELGNGPSEPQAAVDAPPETGGDQIVRWGVQNEANLPEARTNASGWESSGTIYLAGGTDGTNPRGEVFWAVPTGTGDIPEWRRLDVSDLPAEGLEGSAALVIGPNVILVGGETGTGVLASSVRANIAPEAPFFQLGLVGAIVPALQIEGEIGQQLGYLNAAGVGTVMFVLLLLVGWAFANRDRTTAFVNRVVDRRRNRRRV
jgi:hypothetical protein